jgi:hypothetical protein
MPGLTRSPNQRAAAVCLLLAAIVSLIASTAASLSLIVVAMAFAMRARTERR